MNIYFIAPKRNRPMHEPEWAGATPVIHPGSALAYFGSPSAPAPINYGQQTRDTLQAQVDLAPQLYAANAKFGPQYSELQLKQLEDMLNDTPGQQGYLSEYANNILPTLTTAQNTARQGQAAGTLDTLNNLGPAATAAFKSANPGGSALQDALTRTATSQLALGPQLDPAQLSRINRDVNANWSNRGLGTSAPAQLDAAMQEFAGGQNLLQQREQTASAVSGQDYSQSLAPLEALLGQPISSVGTAGNITGTGAGLITGAPDINPESKMSQDIAGANMNAQAAANIAGANSTSSVIGSSMGMMGDVGIAAALLK